MSATAVIVNEKVKVVNLEPSLRDKLRAPLPDGAVKQHPTKTYMSSVNSMYVIERLNDVFGEDGWGAQYRVIEGNPNQAMVVVECVLTCRSASYPIIRQTFGGNDNKDRGDAYKGACTDALTKAASQIGIAQDVYKGMYDKELVGDEKPGRKAKEKKEEYGSLEGIVNNYQLVTPQTLWLKVGETPCRAIDKHLIDGALKNCLGKRVELRIRWDKAKKSPNPLMTVINVLGVYEPVPQTRFDELVSKCKLHGEYPGEGNCPKCEEPF